MEDTVEDTAAKIEIDEEKKDTTEVISPRKMSRQKCFSFTVQSVPIWSDIRGISLNK